MTGLNQIIWTLILMLIAFTHTIRNKSRSLPASIFALSKSKRNIPDLSHQMASFYGLNIGAYSRSIIKKNYIQMGEGDQRLFKVILNKMNISCLFGWDFAELPIFFLDLSSNALRRIIDQHTLFSDVHIWLILSDHRLHHVDLRKTKITQLQLANNRLSDWANHVLLPQTLSCLNIDNNPIGSISNYEFAVDDLVTLTECNLTSLQNVVFNTNQVVLSYNPIRILKNVTFRNVNIVSMMNCGITSSIIKEFELTFIAQFSGLFSHSVEWILRNNSITKQQLIDIGYKLPTGLTRTVLNDINDTVQTYP